MVAQIYKNIVTEALHSIVNNEVVDCAIGDRTVAVESDRGTGIAMLYAKSNRSRKQLDDIEQSVRTMTLESLVGTYLEDDPFYASIGLAAINSLLIEKSDTPAPDYQNAFLHDNPPVHLGLVGYFAPVVHFAKKHGQKLSVFELRDIPDTFRPEDAEKEMPSCDVVILTGSAFSNRSIHHYFPCISARAEAYILGPSTPMADCLGRFFLGSSRILRNKPVFDAIRNNASCGSLRQWMEKTGRVSQKQRIQK